MSHLPENILGVAMGVVTNLVDTGDDTLIAIGTALDSLQHFPKIDLNRANAIAHTAYLALKSEEVFELADSEGIDLSSVYSGMMTLGDLFSEAIDAEESK